MEDPCEDRLSNLETACGLYSPALPSSTSSLLIALAEGPLL